MSVQLLGGLSPILTATKHINIYQKYITEGQNSTVNPNVYNVNQPDQIHSDDSTPPLGRTSEDIPTYGKFNCQIFKSGMIYVDPNLKLMQALHRERDLLPFAGLLIDPTDDVKIMVDGDNNILGAIAIGYSHLGQIITIKYIDVDEDDANFKMCFHKLQELYSPLKYYDSDNFIQKFPINQDVLSG